MTAAPSVEPAVDARKRLLEAARTAFADKGFHGTTTRDIAAAAGMSPAAIYVHHRTKESLLHALSLEGHRRTVQTLRDAVPVAGAPDRQLHAWVAAFVAHHAEGHTTARIVNYELAALTGEHRAEVETLRSWIQDSLVVILERGCSTGDFAIPDTHAAANAIVGMAVDVARWFDDGARTAPADLGRQFADLAVRMVRA